MDPRGAALDLSMFPVRAPCTASANWYLPLYIALRNALGIDGSWAPDTGGAFSASRAFDSLAATGTPLTGGLRVLGTKKRGGRDVVLVDYALFDPDGNAVAWDASLGPHGAAPPGEVRFADADRRPLILDAALKAKIKAMVGAKQRPAARPWEAEEPLNAVAISTDARVVAGVDAASYLYLWDGSTGARLHRIKVGSRPIHDVAFSPDGDRVAIGTTGLTLYDVPTGTARIKLAGHPKGEIWSVDWSPSGRFVATASARYVARADNSVALWDAVAGTRLFSWEHEAATTSTVRFSADGESLVYRVDRSLRRVDTSTGEECARWDVEAALDGLIRLSDGWATVHMDEVAVVDSQHLRPLRRLSIPLADGRARLASTPDGSRIVAFEGDHIGVFDALDGAPVADLPLPESKFACRNLAGHSSRVIVALGATAVHLPL